jgi:RNA polymerase sigma-70 factor, ECF subfamily
MGSRSAENRLKALTQGPDERLLIEAAQRDPARFAELYEANFERVYAYIARRVYVRVDVEDLTAEVFHQALAKIGQFEWRGVPFAAWLYRIAANAIADRWERTAREQGSPASDDPADPQAEIKPEEVERRAQLFRLVDGLPSEQRRVIEMRFAEEKSIAEIASELKRSAGAVKQLQFRGIQNLREQWSKKSRKRLSVSNV